MNVWHLIERDHANIAQLIHEAPMALNGAGVIRSRERLLGELIAEFERHVAGMEASLYDPLSREPSTYQLIEELRHDGITAMRGLKKLSRYRQKNSEGWLNTFEDVTYQVDQYLHRNKHELIPTARKVLNSSDVEDATREFVRKKISVIRRRDRGAFAQLASNQLIMGIAVCAVAAGVALLARRRGLFSVVK